MDILEIKNVAYSYANSKEKVLSGVNQKFELGKFYAIVGKSGTGKSTLLSLLAGLDKPQTGKILFKNEDIQKKGYSNHRKNNISLVFQNYNLIDYLSPIENISEYYGAAEPPVRCGESHLSGLTEPPQFVY